MKVKVVGFEVVGEDDFLLQVENRYARAIKCNSRLVSLGLELVEN